jgi:hypothetical protein
VVPCGHGRDRGANGVGERGVEYWRPSAKENEHKAERSGEVLLVIGISRSEELGLRAFLPAARCSVSPEARDTFERENCIRVVMRLLRFNLVI